MSAIDTGKKVADLVIEKPSRSRVFENLGIDFCCGGKQSLAEACAAKGLDASTVVAVLSASEDAGGPAADATDWSSAPLTALCDNIVSTHHAYLREEMPRLTQMTAKVVEGHGENHPEVRQVAAIYGALREELEAHMVKEEQVLFPAIRSMEQSAAKVSFPFGSVSNPISCMEHEHDAAGDALAKLRSTTNDYTPPADACPTFRAMLDGLAAMELDLHQHIHKENNILFPRAIALEGARG